jgi:sterol desaturase/sphingolipid hydroxylase (fatty acid hydroxylase superfamily)
MSHSSRVKPKNRGTKTLFSNPVLEKLSRTNIAIPISLFSVTAIGLVFYALTEAALAPIAVVALFAGGFLFFTLLEYLAHRYFFHMLPTNKTKAKVQYLVHGVHHEYPKDKDRLAMPPLVAMLYVVILYLVLNYLLGQYVFAFLPGMLLGYATYLGVHYLVHAYQPPKNALKVLWVHHGIHHYKDHTVAFGVSSPLWDYVFRTMPR